MPSMSMSTVYPAVSKYPQTLFENPEVYECRQHHKYVLYIKTKRVLQNEKKKVLENEKERYNCLQPMFPLGENTHLLRSR